MSTLTRSVFISGGAIRIGRLIALHLAQQGWSVAIHYRQSEAQALALIQELQAMGVRAVAVQADFSGDFDAHALLQQASDAVGPLSCLINSAAIYEKDTLADVTAPNFHAHMQVNLFAPLALIQAFAAHRERHDISVCSVINLSDGTYGWSLSPKFLSYALSKHSLMTLTEMLAPELAPHIRINSIGLGPTLPNVNDSPGLFERHAQRSPLKSLSAPDELCRTIDYLLDAPHVTGQHILLTGGLHCVN